MIKGAACAVAMLTGAFAGGLGFADELVIADGRRSDYQIVIPDDAPEAVVSRSLAQAADVLQAMFASNGCSVPIVRESRADKERPGIYLGDTAAARAAGIETSRLPVWAYVWKVASRNVFIAGRDWTAAGTPQRGERACSLGTVKGLADFMREYCGTRFLAPGGLVGIEFLPAAKIAVPGDLSRRRNPMVNYNSGDRPLSDIASIGLNFLNNVTTEYFGHTHERAVPADKYADTHPEYYALVNGRRIREHEHPWKPGVMVKEPHLCYSNKEVQELIYSDMLRSFDAGYPEYLSLQADGFQPCACDPCGKLFGTPDWGEKLWLLNRQWAERLIKDRPGRFLVVTSYTVTGKPPAAFREFPPNVRVSVRSTPEAFAEWAGHGVPGGFTTYLHAWGGYHLCGYLPVRTPLYSDKVVRLYAAQNVKGVGLDSPPANMWALEGPAIYVYARMFDDAKAGTARDLVGEYLSAAYGPAAPAMSGFFDDLHHTLEAYAEVFGVDNGSFQTYKRADGRSVRYLTWQTKLRLIGFLYPPETLATLESRLAQAEKTPGLGEKHRLRLALACREFDYLKGTARVVHLYNAYQTRRDRDTLNQLLDEMESRQKMIMSWCDTKREYRPGVYLQKPISADWPMYVGSGGHYSTHLLANGGSYLSEPVAPFTWNLPEMRRAPLLGPRTITAKKTGGPLSLASPAWASFPEEKLGPRSLGSPAPRSASGVRVAYDAAAIYLRFEGQLPAGWTAPPAAKQDDRQLLSRESFGAVLAPGGDPSRYFRFAGGPDDSTRYDARHGFIEDPIDPRFDQDDTIWNPDWQFSAAVAQDSRNWTALMIVPFASLGVSPPAPGMEWKSNFGRVHRSRPAMPPEESLWSSNPDTASIGDRNAFGTLRFE